MAWVQSLTWEHPYTAGAAKNISKESEDQRRREGKTHDREACTLVYGGGAGPFQRSGVPPPFYLVDVSFNMQQKEPLIRLRVCWGSEVSPSWSQLLPSVFLILCV